MGTVHDLLEARGKQAALRLVMIVPRSKPPPSTWLTRTAASVSSSVAGHNALCPTADSETTNRGRSQPSASGWSWNLGAALLATRATWNMLAFRSAHMLA